MLNWLFKKRNTELDVRLKAFLRMLNSSDARIGVLEAGGKHDNPSREIWAQIEERIVNLEEAIGNIPEGYISQPSMCKATYEEEKNDNEVHDKKV